MNYVKPQKEKSLRKSVQLLRITDGVASDSSFLIPIQDNTYSFIMDFDLEITPDAQVRLIYDENIGDIIEGSGFGNLNLKIEEDGFFKIFGDVIIDEGEYLFTIDSTHSDPNIINTSVSEVPAEHKQHNFGKLDNGQFFAQPNNRMLWFEQSLTPKDLKIPDFQVSTRYFFSEQEEKWAFGDSKDFFYKEKKREQKIRSPEDEFNGE